jgi:glycosyltransferase involved in cell wall biosynthesis
MIDIKQITLTICICTNDRPEVLLRCLDSIRAGARLPDEVIVSDDSKDESNQRQNQQIVEQFAFATYLTGPRRGLCANRNHVIKNSKTSHLSLLDDDAIVSAEFVERLVLSISQNRNSIVTGSVIENGRVLTPPLNPGVFGHFAVPVIDGVQPLNIHLNCNAIPRLAFASAAFDENLVYGYEDRDLCDRLIKRGWGIVYDDSLVNTHMPPTIDKMKNVLAERERFVVILRMKSAFDKLSMRGVLWLPLIIAHALFAYAKRGDFRLIAKLPFWVIRGVRLAIKGPTPLAVFDTLLLNETSASNANELSMRQIVS